MMLNLLNRQKIELAGLDIGSSSIKIVQLKETGKGYRLMNLGVELRDASVVQDNGTAVRLILTDHASVTGDGALDVAAEIAAVGFGHLPHRPQRFPRPHREVQMAIREPNPHSRSARRPCSSASPE